MSMDEAFTKKCSEFINALNYSVKNGGGRFVVETFDNKMFLNNSDYPKNIFLNSFEVEEDALENLYNLIISKFYGKYKISSRSYQTAGRDLSMVLYSNTRIIFSSSNSKDIEFLNSKLNELEVQNSSIRHK